MEPLERMLEKNMRKRRREDLSARARSDIFSVRFSFQTDEGSSAPSASCLFVIAVASSLLRVH